MLRALKCLENSGKVCVRARVCVCVRVCVRADKGGKEDVSGRLVDLLPSSPFPLPPSSGDAGRRRGGVRAGCEIPLMEPARLAAGMSGHMGSQ